MQTTSVIPFIIIAIAAVAVIAVGIFLFFKRKKRAAHSPEPKPVRSFPTMQSASPAGFTKVQEDAAFIKENELGGISMQMKQCPNGHFYNADLSGACPYCAGTNANESRTVPLSPVGGAPAGSAAPLYQSPGGGCGATVPVDMRPGAPGEDGRTVAMIVGETGIDPVVGWLVCSAGPEKGRDYRLHDGNNFIGRDARMDVCIRGDEQISREKNAWIAYDSLNRRFLFGGGEGRNLAYLNGQPMVGGQSGEIKAFDKIRLGASAFLFIPLCCEQFDWEK